MSDHFDSVTAANNAKLDITDTFVFKGNTGTVLVMNTNTPLSPSYTGPGWDTEATYDHKIDLNSDGRPELALRARFSGHDHPDGSPSAQRWSLSLHLGSGADDPESTGLLILNNAATDRVHNTFTGVRAFAGVVKEPFFAPFPLVGAVRTSLIEGAPVDLSAHDPETAVNAFADTSVNTIVIEIPNLLGLLGGLTIGYWASVTGPRDDGSGWRQVDRCGIPMLSTIFGFNDDDDYNEHRPECDKARFGPIIENLTQRAIAANASHPRPDNYARAVRHRFTPDVLRYTIGTEAQLGDGKWNGRAVDEDAAGIVFDYVLSLEFDTGLSIDDAAGGFDDAFPYLQR